MIWGLLAGLTALRLVVAANTPLAPDEAYYWVWSRALAPGYLDHPPMVALWIRAGTWLVGPGLVGPGLAGPGLVGPGWAGHGLAGPGWAGPGWAGLGWAAHGLAAESPLGVRLLAPLAAAAGSILLLQAARDLLGPAARAARALWLLNATLLFGVGAVTMTPDTPLLFFWTAALWALARLHRTGNAAWWLVVGLSTGLAMCSKYTAILLPAGIGLWLLALPDARRWLRRWQSWAGGVLAGLVFAPTLAWNAENGWASFAKQGGRGLAWHPEDAARYLGELVGGQLGLATPPVFLLCIVGVAAAAMQAWRRRDPAAGLLVALTVPPVLLFVEHALGDRVQANWPAIIYPAATIAAAGLSGGWDRLYRPAVGLGLAVTLAVYVQAVARPFPLPDRLDPTARLDGWPTLAAAIADSARDDRFVASDSYGDAALLARLLPPRLQVVGIEPRWAFFALPDARPAIAGQPGLLVRSARRRDPPDPSDWAAITPAGALWRSRDGSRLEQFRLYAVVGRPLIGQAGSEPAVLLPGGAGAP